jgi:hypothetical protein
VRDHAFRPNHRPPKSRWKRTAAVFSYIVMRGTEPSRGESDANLTRSRVAADSIMKRTHVNDETRPRAADAGAIGLRLSRPRPNEVG